MKKCKILLFLLCPLSILFPQSSLVQPMREIFFGTQGCYTTAIFTLELEGDVWEENGNSFVISNASELRRLEYEVPINNNLPGAWDGVDFVNSTTAGIPFYGYGLYKVSCNLTDKFFYIDFKDCNYTRYANTAQSYYGAETDVWIKFNNSTKLYYITSNSSIDFEPVDDPTTLNIWDIKQVGGRNTEYFEIRPPQNISVNEQDYDSPYITWTPDPGTSEFTTHYKVFRCFSQIFDPNPTDFSEIATVDATQLYYLDTDFIFGGWNYVYYKIKAVNHSILSPFSNHAGASLVSMNKKMLSSDFAIKNKYILSQNYPNPFNPSTSILYSVKDRQNVILKVYNILGSEVATLVNEIKEPGQYTVEFNASNLPSGTYVYSIQAGDFSSRKKLSLVK